MAQKRQDAKIRRLSGFSTENSDYAPSKFYCSASDDHGHSRVVRFDAPPSLAGQVAELIAERAFPVYRSAADFYRDAIHHRLRYLADADINPRLAASLRESLEWREVENTVEADEQQFKRYVKIRSDITSVINGMRKAELPPAFVEGHISKYRERIEQLPDPYRTRLLNLLEELE